jgi:hypothetical protein
MSKNFKEFLQEKKQLNVDTTPEYRFMVAYKEKPKFGAKQEIGLVDVNPYPTGTLEIRVINQSHESARILIPEEQVEEFKQFIKKQLGL